jgi:L-seryl-tRNA(Ser) seleniumtransferase
MAEPPQDPRRLVPSVDRLLGESAVSRLIEVYGRDLVRVHAQRQLAALRAEVAAAGGGAESLEALGARLEAALRAESGGLRRVLNATGVWIHTNLGRAPLPRGAIDRLGPVLDAGCDLELDLESGRRGGRQRAVEPLLRAATGAEAALAVNNNAAALLLAFAALGRGRQAIVSRGELVEIGGAFRIPEILTAAGVELVEVGTTNRTRLADYAAALGPETALLLKVLPSNFRISGFVAAVPPEALAELGRRHGVPLLVDEGSGLLRRHPAPQLRDHPSIEELVAAGCDLVASSGDKLLGGPQAGIVVGRQELVARLLRHPLYRALRPDRMQLAALAEVLRAQLRGEAMPLDRMWPEPGAHRARLARLAASTGAEIVPADAYLGGGSAPEAPIPGEALALPAVGDLDRRLRLGEPAVVGYVRDGKLVLDLRTVAPEDDETLLAALQAVGAAR